VRPRAGLDGCGKSRPPHRDSIPVLSTPVASRYPGPSKLKMNKATPVLPQYACMACTGKGTVYLSPWCYLQQMNTFARVLNSVGVN